MACRELSDEYLIEEKTPLVRSPGPKHYHPKRNHNKKSHSPSKHASLAAVQENGVTITSPPYNYVKPLNMNKLLAHFYFGLALILSVLFSFTGVLAFALFFTIPAAIYAKKAIKSNGDELLRKSRLQWSIYCNVTGCIFGSFFGIIFFSGLAGLVSTTIVIMVKFNLCNQLLRALPDKNSFIMHFISCNTTAKH